MNLGLAFDVPKRLRTALEHLVGANVRFRLAIDRPNQPVDLR